MKRLGLDQTSAWLFSLIFSLSLFTAAYILLGKIVKDPAEKMREKIAEHEEGQGREDEQEHAASPHQDEPFSQQRGEHDEAAEVPAHSPKNEPHSPPQHEKHPSKQGENHSMHEGLDTPAQAEPKFPDTAWTYGGRTGPDFWADLDKGFLDCQLGREQSPVDLNNPVNAGDLQPLELHYQKAYVRLTNDGHTILGRHEPGSYLLLQGQRYDLVQFLFHLPSEHTVDGIPFDMELQLIHKNAAGKLAILGVFMEEGAHSHAGLDKLWHELPEQSGESSPELHLNIDSLLPRSRSYFAYAGSLTTPPCSEGVSWLLYTEPIKISSNQIEKFIKIYRNNSRPVQGINKRTVYLSANR